MKGKQLENIVNHVAENGGEASKCELNQLSKEFTLGDIVWIKIHGNSWWPAQVVEGNSKSGSNNISRNLDAEICVRLYGSYECMRVDPMKYRAEFEKVLKKNNWSFREILKKSLERDLSDLKSSSGVDREVSGSEVGYFTMASGQSRLIASQPSSSVPLSSHNPTSGASPATGTISKLPIEFNVDGCAVGPNHAKWNSRVGYYVRAHIPIHYKDWRKVDGSFKNDVWNELMQEFEPNVPQAAARQAVEKDFSQKFRSTKYALRKEILSKCGGVEEAIAACPLGKDPNHWAMFVRNESTDEVKARNAKNAENAKVNKYRHTNGRVTYAHMLDKMDKEDPSRKHGRVDSWKKGHERRDGTILESARIHYEQVEAAQKRRKEASSNGEGSVFEANLDNDELAEVFGPDKSSKTRGISSTKSKNQLQRTAIAKALLRQASSSSNSKLKGELNEMKASISNVMGVLTDVLKLIRKNGTSSAEAACGTTPPEIEVGSNSVSRQTQRNLKDMFDTVNPTPGTLGSSPNVTLLDRNGLAVAKGYVMTETAEICHGRKVLTGEKKVYIEEVLVGDALVYDGPQNGIRYLDGFSAGGPLIWLESRMVSS